MQAIKTVGKLVVVAGAIIMMAAPAMAGNGKGSGLGQGGGDRTRTQTRSQLKDGSCRDAVEKNVDQLQLAGRAKTGDRDGTPDRTRSKDGSCQDAIEVNDLQLLTADQQRLKDMIKDILRDETCQDEEA